MAGKLTEFLRLVAARGWIQPPPRVWNEQYREALSGSLVRIGWGGRIELTDAGRTALEDKP